ncbi:MAG: FecR domain-containing protein [Gemmataceae bacterium]|nr:FecR domain-containing protein [Gemmataceae bacterium]
MISPDDREPLQAYLDGELSETEAAALELRLRSEPALADALVLLSREEAILGEWAGSARANQEHEAEAATLPMSGAASVRRFTIRRLIAIAASGVAALVAVGFLSLLFLGGGHNEPSSTLATVEEMHGDVFIVSENGKSIAAQLGQRIAPGNGIRTQGDGSFVVLTFPSDQSRLEIGPDTTIRLDNAVTPGERGKQVWLEQGTVAADVSKQPSNQPMIVTTPHAEARFLETKSSFASAGSETRIEQLKGQMQLTRKRDGRSIDVPTGSYAVASARDDFAPQPLPNQVLQPRAAAKDQTSPMLSAAYSMDGATLVTGHGDGTIKLWDAAGSEVRRTLKGHKRPVKALAFSPAGGLLASASDDRFVKLWDPVNGTDVGTLKGLKGGIDAIAFSPDGTQLATGGGFAKATPEVRLFDVVSRQEIGSFQGEHTNHVTAVAFSRDGKTLATGGKDNVIKLWDVFTRLVRHTLDGHTNRIVSLAYSPDGQTLASASRDRTVQLWEPDTGKNRRILKGAFGDVRSIAFALDSKRLAVADNNVTLYDVTTGREQASFKGNRQPLAVVLFAPGGKELTTIGTDRTIRFWDAMARPPVVGPASSRP